VFFMAFLLRPDPESKPGTRRIVKHYGILEKTVNKPSRRFHATRRLMLRDMYDTGNFAVIRVRRAYVTIAFMRHSPTWGLLVLLASCEAQISGPSNGPGAGVDAAGGDAAVDAMLGPWSPPMQVRPAATAEVEDDVTLSSNALELIFAIERLDGDKDLYYTSRASMSAAWDVAVLLPFTDALTREETPRFSPDDKTLYFATDRGGNGSLDIWGVTRSAPGRTDWGTPRPLSGVNTTTLVEKWFSECDGSNYVMVQTGGKAGTDLVEGKLGGGAPTPITALNTDLTETGAFVTRDCLTLYFASTRTTPERIYVSRRESLGAPWQPPTVMMDFDALGGDQEDPWLSADGRTFAFAGEKDIYLTTR
jgi:hypothetical protein